MAPEINEVIDKLNNDFSTSNIVSFVNFTGLMPVGLFPTEERFEHLILIRSIADEVYSELERHFVKKLQKIFLFPEIHKSIVGGDMPCRIVAADLKGIGSGIYNAVLFMKIIIKALEGWTFFVLRLNDGIHLGMKVFEHNSFRNCTLCDIGELENIIENFIWIDNDNEFLPLYTFIYELIRPLDDYKDYDEFAVKKRGIKYDYIDALKDISQKYNVDLSSEIYRYKAWYSKKTELSFSIELYETLEDLRDIRSSKVNTLEMLFEAEQIEKITLENEKEYTNTLEREQSLQNENLNVFGDAIKDPETMIKMLKEMKGIS